MAVSRVNGGKGGRVSVSVAVFDSGTFVCCVVRGVSTGLCCCVTRRTKLCAAAPGTGTRLADRRAAQPYLLHLSVHEHREENVDNIVGQCPAVVRKARRARGS